MQKSAVDVGVSANIQESKLSAATVRQNIVNDLLREMRQQHGSISSRLRNLEMKDLEEARD